MARHRSLVALALLSAAAAAPLRAQTYDWQFQWFWGAKGGLVGFTLPSPGQTFDPQFGGEWLISARRTALYVGFSQTATTQTDTFAFTGITGGVPIGFDGMRRLQLGVVVLPYSGSFQPYIGGGFVIETLTNAGAAAALTSSQQAIVDRDLPDKTSGGFALMIVGLQLRSRKLALFGQYQMSPQGRDFLLSGASHSLEFGVRYAFLGAREDDITTRR